MPSSQTPVASPQYLRPCPAQSRWRKLADAGLAASYYLTRTLSVLAVLAAIGVLSTGPRQSTAGTVSTAPAVPPAPACSSLATSWLGPCGGAG